MPNLPHFSTVPELEENQGTPWITTNAMAEVLDKKMTALLTVTMTSADITLTAAQCQNAEFIRVTGALTANHNLIVEASSKFYTLSHQGTGNHTISIKTASGTGVAIDQGVTARVFADGVNVVPAGAGTSSGGGIYDLGFGRGDGLIPSGAIIGVFPVVRPIRLPQNLVSSFSIADAGATLAQQITIKKNGSSIGTVNFAIGATIATYTFAADVDFTNGDIVTWVGPSPADATLAGVTGTLAGIRL